VNFSIQSIWKRSGKVVKTFVAALAVYLILRVAWPGSDLEELAALVTYVLGGWLALRLLRVGLRKFTWRLRNRLVVTYLFIGVLPVLLVLTLVGLGGYMLAGQMATYLVRSELERRLVVLRSVASDLENSPANIQGIANREVQKFPGLILCVSEHGETRAWPADANVKFPPGLAMNASGVVYHNRRYYGWADAASGDQQALALVPLTRHYLSGLEPELGDIYFLQQDFSEPPKDKSADVNLAPAGGDQEPAPVPPAVNEFDVNVRWWSLLQTADWSQPERTKRTLLAVHTRPSAILGAILTPGADESQGGVLAVFYGVAIAFLAVGVAGLAIGISISRNITGAVHSLYAGTRRVMHGDFSHLIQVKGRDQIAELATSFNTMTQNLEHLLAVSKEKERLETEIEIARGVQDQLYPKAPPVMQGLEVLGMCHPARMVSGDYYDYQLVDGRLAIAIGDVAGKGISAALLMATIQAAVRMELRTSIELPASSMNGTRFSTARMVSELNMQLHATTSPEKYATFFFAIYDPATGLLTYTNAGHLQPVLFRAGTATPLDVNGTVVGAFPFSKYEESKLELRAGDLLLCYTDGITEPENEYGEMFGEQRLIEVVAKNADREESQIIESVMECVREWTGAPELSDDMTVLVARKR
jgi:phosphoserine phosphatase RsbU/P